MCVPSLNVGFCIHFCNISGILYTFNGLKNYFNCLFSKEMFCSWGRTIYNFPLWSFWLDLIRFLSKCSKCLLVINMTLTPPLICHRNEMQTRQKQLGPPMYLYIYRNFQHFFCKNMGFAILAQILVESNPVSCLWEWTVSSASEEKVNYR